MPLLTVGEYNPALSELFTHCLQGLPVTGIPRARVFDPNYPTLSGRQHLKRVHGIIF